MPSQSTILLTLVALVTLGMVYIGYQNFVKNHVDASRDAMKEDIASLSQEALSYYHLPRNMGGGGRSFINFNDVRRRKVKTKKNRPVPEGDKIWESENGVYYVLVAAKDSVVIEGRGDYTGEDGENLIRIRGVIKTDDFYFTILN